jgi:hypothetical protein
MCPNKNYVKGRTKEYKIVKELRDEGYDIVQRSAGSHSAIDIFAINRNLKKIKFIQSKPDNFSDKNAWTILAELEWLDGFFDVEFLIR